LCYLYDVLVVSGTFQQHISDITEVFQRLQETGLKLGPCKRNFAQSECVFLGHLIFKEGIQPPRDLVCAIQEYPPPKFN